MRGRPSPRSPTPLPAMVGAWRLRYSVLGTVDRRWPGRADARGGGTRCRPGGGRGRRPADGPGLPLRGRRDRTGASGPDDRRVGVDRPVAQRGAPGHVDASLAWVAASSLRVPSAACRGASGCCGPRCASPGSARLPTYGDYAVQHPEPPMDAVEGQIPLASGVPSVTPTRPRPSSREPRRPGMRKAENSTASCARC